MSKSLGNHIGITEAPGEMYGRTLSLPDEAMDSWFDAARGRAPAAGTSPRDAKHALARALVERFHGAGAARDGRGRVRRASTCSARSPTRSRSSCWRPVNGEVHLPAAIAEGFGMSRSEARRMLAQGGVRLDGEPLAADELDLPRERLDGAVLQVGKRHFRRLRVS